jgi:hypothetical protein
MPKSDGHAAPAAEPAPRAAPPPFRGFTSPNYTPVPDELFDELLVALSGAELKAVLYIIRRTFGFKRESDTISLSQMLGGIRTRDGRVLDRGVGLSKKTLLLALRSLEERGIILTERRQSAAKGNEPTAYQLNVLGTDGTPAPVPPTPGGESTPPLGEKLRQGGGGKSTPTPWGRKYTTQEIGKQETERQEAAEQNTEDSSRFELLASMQQEREANGFSKRTRSVETSRQASGAQSAGMTAVSEIVARRRRSTPRISVLQDAPQGPKTPPARAESDGDALLAGSGPPMRSGARSEAHGRPRRDEAGGSTDRTKGGRRPPPPKLPPYLEGLVARYSEELHDDEHLPQNLGQAGRLWEASGWSEAAFGQALNEAKAITLKRDIKKRAAVGGEYGARNKMPYYFKVLRDLLGLKERDDARTGTGG